MIGKSFNVFIFVKFILFLFIVGCSGGGSVNGSAPVIIDLTGSLTLSQTSYVGEVNMETPNITVTAAIDSPSSTIVFRVNPDLPSGLILDSLTGEISGTPTMAQETTEYTLLAVGTGNYSGIVEANLSIKINTPISGSLTLLQTSYVGEVNMEISNITVTAAIDSPSSTIVFRVNPDLPSGLILDSLTGEISGIPTMAQETTEYTLLAVGTGNYSGIVEANLSIKINTPISGSLTLLQTSYVGEVNMEISNITVMAAIDPPSSTIVFRVNPDLPSGLILDSLTGEISGTLTMAQETTEYTLLAVGTGNYSGIVEANLSIKINTPISGSLTLSQTSYVGEVNMEIPNITVTAAIDPPSSTIVFRVNPDLPSGLILDSLTGEISGTPTTLASTLYTLTANGTVNYIGSVNINFSLTINPSLTNIANIVDDETLKLNGASSLTTTVIDGITYLFVAGQNDNGVSVFSVSSSGTLTNVDNVTDDGDLRLLGVSSLTTTVIDGTTYLFVAGETDNGVSVFSVSSSGTLANVDNVADHDVDNLNFLGASSLTATMIDGTTYLFVAGQNDNGVSVFSVSSSGTLTNVDNVTDDENLSLLGASSLTTTVIDGTTYLFVAGQSDNGVSVFSVSSSGTLANVDNVVDDEILKLFIPNSLITAVIDGTTYLFVAGFIDNGVSVFSVSSSGTLANVDNVTDDENLSLFLTSSLTTTMIDGVTYLFVTGQGDNGVSVFSVASDGELTNIANIVDDETLKLDGAVSSTTTMIDGISYLFVIGHDDDGVSMFRLK